MILGAAIFGMVNFYGVSYLVDAHSSLATEVSDLENQERANQIWLREKNLWLNRKKWIESAQPRIHANQVPQSELLESLQSTARANHLEIQEQSFGADKSTPNYQSVSVRLKVSGPLQDVIRWLVQVQQPELFQAVTSFSLKSANEPPTVSLELEVARWYAPNT